MLLDATTKKIQIVMDAAATTTESDWIVDYVDITATGIAYASNTGVTTGATAVDAVAAPAAATQRKISEFTITNRDTVNRTVTVRYNNNGTIYILMSQILTPGQSLVYEPNVGWKVGAAANTVVTGGGGGYHLATKFWQGYTHSNNATQTKIDITAGSCRDSTDMADIVNAAGTLDLNVTGVNGFDTGSWSVGSWYYTYAIAKDDGTAAFLCSSNKTTPTLPSGYTKFRRIGAFATVSAGADKFVQIDDTWWWNSPSNDYTNSGFGTTPVTFTLYVPRILGIGAIMAVQAWSTSSAGNVLIQPTFVAAGSVASNGCIVGWDNAGGNSSDQVLMPVDGSGQIRAVSNVANTHLVIFTQAWRDKLLL